MFKIIKSILLVSFILALSSSCKKYDEDEKRSWRTVKSRITQKWRIDFNTIPSIEYEFKKDGTMLQTGYTKVHKWIFDAERNHFFILYENGVNLDFEINQLEKERMVATFYSSGLKNRWVFTAID